MFIHFDDTMSLTGAKWWKRDRLVMLYGVQQTLELECIAGDNNVICNIEHLGCTFWDLNIIPSLSSPYDRLVHQDYNENIAIGNKIVFSFTTETVEMYKYVAGNPNGLAVIELSGYEPGETVPTLVIQLPITVRTTAVNPMPNNGSTTGGAIDNINVNGTLAEIADKTAYIDLTLSNIPSDEDHQTVTQTEKNQWSEAQPNTIESISFNGTEVPVDENKTAKINVHIPDANDYIPQTDKGVSNGVAELDSSGTVPLSQLPPLDYIPMSSAGASNGVATLDSNTKVPVAQIPALSYIPMTSFGTAGGVATLDSNTKVPVSQIPSLDYIPVTAAGSAEGVAQLDSNVKVPLAQIPDAAVNVIDGIKVNGSSITPVSKIVSISVPTSADYIPQSDKGASNGVATLNSNGKIPASQLPSMDYIPNSEKGAANGVASLDSTGKVPYSELPAMNYAPEPIVLTTTGEAPTTSTAGVDGQRAVNTADGKAWTCFGNSGTDQEPSYVWEEDVNSNQKGAANGVAPLDSSGLVPSGNLPGATSSTAGAVKVIATRGIQLNESNQLVVVQATTSDIDSKNNNYLPITPKRIDYAVRSVSPTVTTIPAATTSYALTDATATTNNHSWQYSHIPDAATTYTFPAVTDTSVAHYIKLTIDFTTVQTYSFVDSQGTAITPLFTPTIAAGDVYEFRCEYSAVQSKWLIYPCKQGAVSDDYVMQAEVGAANGVAGLDSNGLVPVANLPVATSSTVGVGCFLNTNGVSISSSGSVFLFEAQPSEISSRNQRYRPITPTNLNYAVTAALTDANHITLTAEQQATAQSVIGVSAPIVQSGAPTTSTVGSVGQLYVDTATSKTYHCTAVTVDDTDPQNPVTTYTWMDDINANGGSFTEGASLTLETTSGRMIEISTANSAPYLLLGTDNYVYPTAGGLIFGMRSAMYAFGLTVGWGLISNKAYAITCGQNNIPAEAYIVVGSQDTDFSTCRNALELSKQGDMCVAGGYQHLEYTIPTATTEFTLREGEQSHVPSASPTYILPDISSTPSIKVRLQNGSKDFDRSPQDDMGSIAWRNGGDVVYTQYDMWNTTASIITTHSEWCEVYSDAALSTKIGDIMYYYDDIHRTHEITLDVLFTGYSRSTTDDGTGYYAWKDTSNNLVYTDTDTPTVSTTIVYSDTALTTNIGTVMAYDSAHLAISMVASCVFQDSAGNVIVPTTPAVITPGAVITFLCIWNGLLEQWVVMPIPQGYKL